MLSRLANFDIAEMLKLAERVISSPTLNVDDLVRSYVTPKEEPAFDQPRVMRAMILGDYDRHSPIADRYIFNLFATEGNYPYSPLLSCSILLVLLSLRIAASSTNFDASHMTIASLLNFFEPCGVARDETRRALKELFEHRLVAPLDPADEEMKDSTKVAITARGQAHLDLASRDATYLGQMALVTGFRYSWTRETLDKVLGAEGDGASGLGGFAKYIMDDDAVKLRVPNVEGYSVLTKFRNEFAMQWKREAGE